MKYLVTLSLTIFFACALVAQDKVGDIIPLTDFPESKALVEAAQSYANATVSSDYLSLVEMTHPDIISIGGGEDFLIEDLKRESNTLTKQGLKYNSFELGTHPEFLKSKDELQTIIPIKYFLSLGDKTVESWVNLFAVSSDEGKTWSFVNLEKFDEVSLKEFVRNVSSELVYPQ